MTAASTPPPTQHTPKGTAPPGQAKPAWEERRRRAGRMFRRAQFRRNEAMTIIEQLLAGSSQLLTVLEGLTDAVLEDVCRRSRFAVGNDGFTSSSNAEKVMGSGGDVDLTSVEAAANARLYESSPNDPAGRAIMELLDGLLDASNACADIERSLAFLRGIEPRRGRDNSVELCAACNGPIAGRLHRIDGQPFHDYAVAGEHGNCYRQENWRRRRGLPHFGLVGDGVTDDLPAFQAAQDEAAFKAAQKAQEASDLRSVVTPADLVTPQTGRSDPVFDRNYTDVVSNTLGSDAVSVTVAGVELTGEDAERWLAEHAGWLGERGAG